MCLSLLCPVGAKTTLAGAVAASAVPIDVATAAPTAARPTSALTSTRSTAVLIIVPSLKARVYGGSDREEGLHQPSRSSTKHQRHASPGSIERITGCMVS